MTLDLRLISDILPAQFTVRAPSLDDAETIAGLVRAYDIAIAGSSDESAEDWHHFMQMPSVDRENGMWLVFAPNGQLAGMASCQDERHNGVFFVDGYTHPEYANQGIGTALMRMAEKRAEVLKAQYESDIHLALRAASFKRDPLAIKLLESEGFTPVRYWYRMEIHPDAPPPAPEWPEGFTVRTHVVGQDDRLTHACVTEAFLDHWGSTPLPFEEWRQITIERETFNPDLWHLAFDNANGELAGAALCRMRGEDVAWVNTLAVRRPWRKKGLGMALLRHAFGEFYRQGHRRIGLGVDANSPTGATRLYERAGMHVVEEFVTFDKVLREGRKLHGA